MKHYVSKETAIKLKEIGFNEYCKSAFISEIVEEEGIEPEELGWYADEVFINYTTFSNQDWKGVTTIPEMYEVQDWFRDKEVIIEVFFKSHINTYEVYIARNKRYNEELQEFRFTEWISDENYKDYYEALEAGILKAIEIYESNIKIHN